MIGETWNLPGAAEADQPAQKGRPRPFGQAPFYATTCLGVDEEKRNPVYEARLRELGKVRFRRIEVAPFSVKRFRTRFGLIPQPPDPQEEGDEWAVEFHPGNVMAFYKPWDSGDYDA